MPPLIFLALAGAGCYAGYKLFSKLIEQAQTPSRSETERIRREAHAAAERKAAGTRNLGELELDQKSGVYRPRNAPNS